jgi:hypothetical protein
LEAEVAKVQSEAAKPVPALTLTLPRQTAAVSAAPPLPTAPRRPEYSVLPPLPDPRSVSQPVSAIASAGAAAASTAVSTPVLAPFVPPPRVTVGCMLPSDYGTVGSCATIQADTRLSVRADENLPAGLRLRFFRRGSARGEITLAAMQQGQSLSVRPPAELCTGVLRSRAEIEIVKPGTASGQAVQKLGPYELRCY